MKKNYLIGLGGSGGKVITRLYERLIAERGPEFADDVMCIAIDTDQDELNDLARMGVEKVCISGSETVGQLFAQLGDDVGEWCPNTANEGVFFSSPVFNGASQCRLKSRLCFANFLRNTDNQLAQALEDSLTVSATSESTDDAPPTILIVSSIAGGTGSGIFIHTALYIKKFFRQYNVEPVVHGLFACPDLYKSVVPRQQVPNLYANAYAVIRELNAFNMICGNYEVNAKDLVDIDMEISSECEGKLFEKDAAGRYGDKPYDLLYFIDKVNSLKRVLGGLEEYYEAMANIAYSHLYTAISGEVMSVESNEMKAHNTVPTAIYGSAGAATMRYPYEDMLHYFASRSIKESVGEVWTVIDEQWKNYVREKDMAERARGRLGYTPEQGDRAKHYIETFEHDVVTDGVKVTELSFLSSDVIVVQDEEDVFRSVLAGNAVDNAIKSMLNKDERIRKYCEEHGFENTGKLKERALTGFESYLAKPGEEREKMDPFGDVHVNDEALEKYCTKVMRVLLDNSVFLSNEVFCTDEKMWSSYDKKPSSIVTNLLYNQETGTWTHPVAARYLLYSFFTNAKKKYDDYRKAMGATGKNTADEYLDYLRNVTIASHISKLDPSEEQTASNYEVFHDILKNKGFGYKKNIVETFEQYFESLKSTVNSIHATFRKIMFCFMFEIVEPRVAALIEEYELFFDKIDEFKSHAQSAENRYGAMHDNAKIETFVCASENVKKALYDELGNRLNTQTGEIASRVSEALFTAMREQAVARSAKKGKKIDVREQSKGVEALFEKVENIVADGARDLTAIQGELDMNVFQAILCEYRLLNPDNAGDIENYAKLPAAKVNINAFVAQKLSGLSKMAAPMLVFDAVDSYSGMLDEGETVERRVTNAYRFLSHNTAVDESIRKLVGASDKDGGAVQGFYNEHADVLPKDTDGQTVTIGYKKDDKVDSYSVLCYATAHCLQPYQIKAFDELSGGVYFEHYARAISDMEDVQRYSMTPHLDKRWHKHGVLPYINLKKEEQCRTDMAKAFLFALCYGKFVTETINGREYVVFQDEKLGRAPERIYYNGYPVLREQINRAVYWFVNQEALIERYAVLFDQKVEIDLEKMMAESETVQKYEANITGHSALMKQMWKNILRASKVTRRRDGTVIDPSTMEPELRKKYEEKQERLRISVLDLAYRIHISEETEIDRDYGELIVEAVCELISKYAKRPFNAKDIAKENKGSHAYADYLWVLNHFAGKFLLAYAEDLDPKNKGKKGKNTPAAQDENAQNNTTPAEEQQVEYLDTGDDDLSEGQDDDVIQSKSIFDVDGVTAKAKAQPGYQWVLGELSRHIDA